MVSPAEWSSVADTIRDCVPHHRAVVSTAEGLHWPHVQVKHQTWNQFDVVDQRSRPAGNCSSTTAPASGTSPARTVHRRRRYHSIVVGARPQTTHHRRLTCPEISKRVSTNVQLCSNVCIHHTHVSLLFNVYSRHRRTRSHLASPSLPLSTTAENTETKKFLAP